TVTARASGARPYVHPFPTRRSSDLPQIPEILPAVKRIAGNGCGELSSHRPGHHHGQQQIGNQNRAMQPPTMRAMRGAARLNNVRSEEHTSELQSREKLVCRLLLEKI